METHNWNALSNHIRVIFYVVVIGYDKTFTCILVVLNGFKNIIKYAKKNFTGGTIEVMKTTQRNKCENLKIGGLKPSSILASIENKWIPIPLDLSSFVDPNFSDMIFDPWWLGFSRVLLSKLLNDIKALFYSRHHW